MITLVHNEPHLPHNRIKGLLSCCRRREGLQLLDLAKFKTAGWVLRRSAALPQDC